MDFEQIVVDNINIITVLFCYCVGIVIKKWIKDVNNKHIPTIVAILGVIINVWVNAEFTPQVVLGGLISGLASCGTFDLIQRLSFFHKPKVDNNNTDVNDNDEDTI